VLLAAVGGCVSLGDDHYKLNVWYGNICWAEGSCRPWGSDKDYFTLVLDALEHPEWRMRGSVMLNFRTTTVMMAIPYTSMADAYIDAGRTEEASDALWAAWRRAPTDTPEQYSAAGAFVHFTARAYIWQHPEVGREAGYERKEKPMRGWSGAFQTRELEFLAKRIIPSGDERFAAAWEVYREGPGPIRPERRAEEGAPAGRVPECE